MYQYLIPLFFYLESFAILHQDNPYFHKQIRIVYKTTVILHCGVGNRFVLKYFIFILIQCFLVFVPSNMWFRYKCLQMFQA